jgi:(p)ppGpp synthase/HD superfamily hydrolase
VRGGIVEGVEAFLGTAHLSWILGYFGSDSFAHLTIFQEKKRSSRMASHSAKSCTTLLPSMNPLLKRALDQAAVWHRDQKRKYPGVDVPYMSHLAGVSILLARHGFDDEVVAAGALHDSIEDCGVTVNEVSQLFGERVAHLVAAVSETDKSLPWEERKQRYVEQFSKNPWEAQAITIADKIDNFQSIIVCKQYHGDPWAMFKRGRESQMWRFLQLQQRVRTLPHHALISAFDEALEALTKLD